MIKRIISIMAAMLIGVAAFSQQKAQSPREELYNMAKDYQTKGRFEMALDKYRQLCEKYPGMEGFVSKDMKECEEQLEKQRAAARSKTVEPKQVEVPPAPVVEEPKLELSEQAFYIFPEGTSKDVSITCNGDWIIDYCPPWCEILKQTRGYLSLMFRENMTGKKRSDAIRISYGDLHRAISITQDPMPELRQEKCKVFFRTIPKQVEVTILDSHVYRDYASHSYDLSPGEHKVSFNKLGYEQLDTVLVIPEAKDKNMMILDIAMEPTFGLITPLLTLGQTHLLKGKKPEIFFTIDGNHVSLESDVRARSFDSSEGIVNGALYKGGCIPLDEGRHVISAVAVGYEPVEEHVYIAKGENLNFTKELKLITGSLIVHDVRDAEDAEVCLSETGLSVGKVGEMISLPEGIHKIEVIKNGYRCDSGEMIVDVRRNGLLELKAAMTRLVTCKVSTLNRMEEVSINGKVIGFQDPVHVFDLEAGKEYDMEVSKEGHWPFCTKIKVSPADTLKDFQGIWLEPLRPLTIRTNEPGCTIYLYKKDSISVKSKKRAKKGEDRKGPDYARMTSPMDGGLVTLYVPKAKYKVDIRRKTGVNKVAYKGNIDFTKEKNRFTVNPRPRSNFITIGADYSLFRQPFAGVSSVSNPDVTVPFVGSAWFGQFRFPAPGFSTNIIKTSVMDCMNVALPEGVNPENARNYMFAFTPLFVNYDFRIGGSFLQYGDVNLLLSYSWYPELTRFLPMSHFSGHEAFGGLEVASRFKMLNLNVRAGLQYFNGDRHYFEPDGKKMSKVADQFIPADHFEQMMFVVTAGISLGPRKANGRNVIRLF